MKIKDIVNRDLINLTNCEHEPIHIPGSIQPHGLLLGLDPETLTVGFCSGNTPDFIHLTHHQILGKTFTEIFGNASAEALRKHLTGHLAMPLKLVLSGKPFQCSIHHNGNKIIFEAEPDTSDANALAEVYSQTIQFVSNLDATSTLKQLCELVAQVTRQITGYDRVMIYRFDREYNGEVFAENCREDLEPFLGLHYPHTDIPVQARELYLKNLMRLIADINYVPVPLYTIDDGRPEKTLDLSLSVLRSTSPVHVEYLQNMGVGATLTISLIHQGRLWGLIACHHYAPKNLSFEIRMAAQLQGQFITSQIDVRQAQEEYEVSRKTNISLEKLTAYNLPPIMESFKIISLDAHLLQLCNASGVSMLINGEIYKNGLTPADKDIKMLSEWMGLYSNDGTFHSDKLIDFVPELKMVHQTVSGVIYHALGNGNSILWYRPETLTEVHWAGDPEKAIIKDHRGLHPRNSFNLWRQIIKNRSNPWAPPELNTAANFAHALQKQISLMLLSHEEEKYRTLSEKLKETNTELENINWISTHDLQEPLRKIQFVSSMMVSKEKNMSENLSQALVRINTSAERMQTLLSDILKYTRIKYSAEAFESVNLNDILAEILEELKETLKERNATINSNKLPVVQGVPFLLKQLFSNIILNSLKYASAERAPKIEVTASDAPFASVHTKTNFCHSITFQDNGIGFDQQYADSIFNIFSRLHNHTEYQGSGVGLALCKKIMQTHEGAITAQGSDQGAAFTVFFPCADD